MSDHGIHYSRLNMSSCEDFKLKREIKYRYSTTHNKNMNLVTWILIMRIFSGRFLCNAILNGSFTDTYNYVCVCITGQWRAPPLSCSLPWWYWRPPASTTSAILTVSSLPSWRFSRRWPANTSLPQPQRQAHVSSGKLTPFHASVNLFRPRIFKKIWIHHEY